MDRLNTPKRIYAGPGCLSSLREAVDETGAKKICLLMDPFVRSSAKGEQILNALEGLSVTVLDDFRHEPTFASVRALLALPGLPETELFIAVGGGTVMDTAKALTMLCTQPELMDALPDVSGLRTQLPPWFAVPTTAGTGAEATPNTILLDEPKQLKVGIVSPRTIATCVFLDSELLASLPRQLVIFTGLDALAHAVEAYTCKKRSPFLELYAPKATQLIFENFSAACAGDLNARQAMQLAAYYAGVCLTVGSTHAAHAAAYPLSGIFHVPHGETIAALLPGAMHMSAAQCEDRLAILAYAIGEKPDAASFLRRLDSLYAQEDVRFHLEERYGVKPSDYPAMAAQAIGIRRLLDQCPVEITEEGLVELYRSIPT